MYRFFLLLIEEILYSESQINFIPKKMKKTTLKVATAIIALAGVFSVNAQQKTLLKSSKIIDDSLIQLTEDNQRYLEEYDVVRCYSTENELALQQKNGGRYKTQDFEQWIAPLVDKIKADQLSGKAVAPYQIPVVVHVIHNGDPVNTTVNNSGENISDAQVLSQIRVLNEDFQRLVGTPGGANTTGLAVNTQVSFCMAQTSPTATLTNGINRVNITPPNNTTAGVADDWETRADIETMKANTQWDPTKYMNMWSIKFGGLAANQGGMQGILGYAQFPSNSGLSGLNTSGGSANTDGVVSGYQFFGTSDGADASYNLSAPYDKGRTMTHEVGHWIGLRHIWGDPNTNIGELGCNVDDFCADTPNSDASNGGCLTTHVSCGTTDQVQNYMDYSNDTCMDTFTPNQLTRMIAVMENSPRRASLATSTRCQAPTPYVSYSALTQNVTEGTDCNFTDVTVTLKIGKAPSATATATVTTSGTANADDYQFLGGNTVTFPAGQTADKTITIRVVNDGFVEGSETLILNINVANGGGNAVVTTENTMQQTITIIDNDAVSISTQSTVLQNFDFESAVGLGVIDADGDGQTFTFLTSQYSGTVGRSIVSVINEATFGDPATNYDPNNYLILPAVTIPADATNTEFKFEVGTNAASGDNYSVYFSPNTGTAAEVLAGTLLESRTSVGSATETRTINVAALAGQTGSFVFRHHDKVGNTIIILDSVLITATVSKNIQTTLNSGAPDLNSLSSSGTIYTANAADGNVMTDITNTSGVDYGCVSTSVSRATGSSVFYQVAGAANFVMGKSFTITPGTIQAGGNATLKFYFTEAEILEWETTTGNNRNTLAIIKDNGSSETIAATIGAFGGDVTLSGNFASGINGTYYFGKMESVLGVTESHFNILSVYPNPSLNGIFNLSVSTADDARVKLFDIRGRNVYSKLHTNNSDVFNTTLDFSLLASGVYVLDIESGAKRAVKKIVIQ